MKIASTNIDAERERLKTLTDDELEMERGTKPPGGRFIYDAEGSRRWKERLDKMTEDELLAISKDNDHPKRLSAEQEIDHRKERAALEKYGDPAALTDEQLREASKGLGRYDTFLEELQKRDRRRSLLRGIGIPKLWFGISMETVQPLHGQQPLIDALNSLAAPKGLFIYGNAGCGKSYLSAALAIQQFEQHQSARFIRWRALLRNQRKRMDEKLETDLLEEAIGTRILVLDDFGAGNISEWTVEIAEDLLDERLDNGRQTIITSNYSIAELAKRMGNRVASRCSGLCKPIQIKGQDNRRIR